MRMLFIKKKKKILEGKVCFFSATLCLFQLLCSLAFPVALLKLSLLPYLLLKGPGLGLEIQDLKEQHLSTYLFP